MKETKISISDLIEIEEHLCQDCKNYEDKSCFILATIAANGKSDAVFFSEEIDKDTGSFFKCMMRGHAYNTQNVLGWVDTASTEDVKEVLEKIEGSYHYDVIDKMSGG